MWNPAARAVYLVASAHGSAGFLHHTSSDMDLTRLRRTAAVLLMACTVPFPGVSAQETATPRAPATAATSLFPASAADTVEVLLVARATDTVRVAMDRLLGERRDAETRWAALRDQSTRLKGTITELQNAIDSASAREKLAKKDKREADRITAAADKRQLQRARELVEARFELRQAQDEEARIHRDFIDASIRAHDAELSIAERRDQVVPTDPSQRTVFQELTSRWLQALRTRSARANDLEDRRFKVIDAQIALLKRQRE